MKSFSLVFLRFYVKLQDAYVSESNKVGSWKLIGYVAPGAATASVEGATTNFKYLAGSEVAVAADAQDVKDFSAITWAAANKVALNDCAAQPDADAAGANWTLTTAGASNGNSVSYTAETNCSQLTPSFDKIGK